MVEIIVVKYWYGVFKMVKFRFILEYVCFLDFEDVDFSVFFVDESFDVVFYINIIICFFKMNDEDIFF